MSDVSAWMNPDANNFDLGRIAQSPGLCPAEFLIEELHDEEGSKQCGYPKWKATECIRIVVPGDKFSEVVRPVREIDKQIYSRQYDAFKKGQEQIVSGTSLKVWAPAAGHVKSLLAFNVRTVEELASVSDDNLSRMGPLLGLRQQARDYLASAKGEEVFARLRAQAEKSESEVKGLKDELAELKALLDAKTKPEGGEPEKRRFKG